MELSAKVLREVEFRDRLRGYDTDEVDEFLEKVAVAVDELSERMRQLAYRAERAERSISDRAADEDEDSIRRTLVLAQRTADLAVREAQEQAAGLMDGARSEADKLLSDARENARRLASDSERRHRDEIARLENQRDQVRGELLALSGLLDAERKRLSEALGAALRFVERTLTTSTEPSGVRSGSSSSASSGTQALDDLEAQINEDAAAAAPSLPLSSTSSSADADEQEDEEVDSDSGGGRANLAALPALKESGPDTEANRSQLTMPISQLDDEVARAKVDAGLSSLGGSDWTA